MSDSPARVGIVVRTKDRPLLLARTLSDLAAQEYTDWHAVIVNDGGLPEPVDELVRAAAPDIRDRITIVHHVESVGRSAAANVGVMALRTEFVVLHDDDDLWHPRFLHGSVDWLDTRVDDIGVVSRTEIVFERVDGDAITELSRAPFWARMTQITYAELLQVNRFVPIAYVYRRAVHDEVGLYREDIHAAEDWEFNLRVAQRHTIGYIADETRAYWMQRRSATGALGNSMFVLAQEHEYYDRMIRDEALRTFTQSHGDGLALYLARFVQDEVARQLDERRTLGQRLMSAAREFRRGRRS